MPALVERYRRGAEALGARSLEALDAFVRLHDETVRFVDPLREVVGHDALRALHTRLFEGCSSLRLDVVDAAGEGEVALYTWVLACSPRRGPALVVHGATHVREQRGLVVFRRDYWDVPTALLGHMPLLGAAYRNALARLG